MANEAQARSPFILRPIIRFRAPPSCLSFFLFGLRKVIWKTRGNAFKFCLSQRTRVYFLFLFFRTLNFKSSPASIREQISRSNFYPWHFYNELTLFFQIKQYMNISFLFIVQVMLKRKTAFFNTLNES